MFLNKTWVHNQKQMYGFINYCKKITPYNYHPIKKQNLTCHLQRPSLRKPQPNHSSPKASITWPGFFLILSTKYTSLHITVQLFASSIFQVSCVFYVSFNLRDVPSSCPFPYNQLLC